MDTTPPWLRDAIRFALTATASTETPWFAHDYDAFRAAGGGDLVDPKDPGKDPRFRKLVEGILFSRRLLNTYNLVLLGVLGVFTAWHWAEKVVLLHRRKRIVNQADRTAARAEEEEEVWSSSSSTLEGNATPPNSTTAAAKKINSVDADADESSPLLRAPQHPRPQRKRRGLWTPYYKLKSLLQYQPPRLPLVHKTLPTNAVSLLVIAWIALNVFYNFYRMPLSLMYLFVFADRCGIIFIVNLPLLYLLAAKNQPVKILTGYSYESLNIFHRRVGELVCLEAFLHFLGMLAVWYGMLRHLGFTLARFLFNRVVLLGLAALVAYEVIYFTSLGSFRKRWYEVFLGLHVVLQVAGLVFLWFHHHTSRPYVGISLAIWLVDRVVYRMWLRSSTHPATLTILEDDETLLLSANWDIDTKNKIPRTLLAKNMTQGWNPNEHIFLSVPGLSRKHAIQSHPFTIFSAAPTQTPSSARDDGQQERKHAWLSLLIRPQAPSGFTHTLLRHARDSLPSPTHLRIRLDGPYGSSHALDLLSASSTAILVAGGSGIAVAYPLLYALLHPSPSHNDDLEMRPSTRRKVKLLWITHSPDHRLWIPEEKVKELEDWGLDVLVPPPTSLAGRPDVGGIVREWVEEEEEEEEEGSSGVVVSGPDGLVRDVRNTVAGLIGEGRDVDVQVEKFGW